MNICVSVPKLFAFGFVPKQDFLYFKMVQHGKLLNIHKHKSKSFRQTQQYRLIDVFNNNNNELIFFLFLYISICMCV